MQISVCNSDARVASVVANFLRAQELPQVCQFCVPIIVRRDVFFQLSEEFREHTNHNTVFMWIQERRERKIGFVFLHKGHRFRCYITFSQHVRALLLLRIPGNISSSFWNLYERFKGQLYQVLSASSKIV